MESKLIILLVVSFITCTNKKSATEYNDIAMEIYTSRFLEDGNESDSVINVVLDNLDMAIKTDSNYILAYTNKLDILKTIKRYPEAISVCDDLLKLKAPTGGLFLQKGVLFEKLGQKNEALEMYQLASQMLKGKNNLEEAVTKFLLNDSVSAQNSLKNLKELNPRDSAMINEFIGILSSKNRNEILEMF